MKRVAANMLPLLTCPAFLLWHLLGAAICIPSFLYACSSNAPDTGGLVGAFVLPFWSAIVVTSLQRDLFAVPVSFCLPGHRSVQRRLTFLAGVITSLIASLPVLNYPGLVGPGLIWAIWSAFCFAMIIYLLVAGLLFLVDAGMMPVGLGIVLGALLIELPAARMSVQDAAILAPGLNTLVLATVATLMWLRIGSVTMARRICDGRFLSLQMAWRRRASEQFSASGKLEALSKSRWWERRWFLQALFTRISRRPALTFRRNLAATQYEVAGYLVPVSRNIALIAITFVLVLLFIAGYAPPWHDQAEVPAANVLYIATCFLCMHLWIPVFSTMLRPIGRAERFFTALVIAICLGLVVLVIMLLMYLLLLGAGSLAPPLSLGGVVYHFEPANLAPAFVPFVLLPINFVLKLVCKKWLLIPEILLFLSAIIVVSRGGAALNNLSPLTIAVTVSASWAFLVSVVYSYCFHGDLVQE